MALVTFPDRPADDRDLVIEDFADREAALLERLASLEADVAIYRELTQAAIHALHHLTRRHACLRDQHQQLQDAYRALRRWTMHRDRAA